MTPVSNTLAHQESHLLALFDRHLGLALKVGLYAFPFFFVATLILEGVHWYDVLFGCTAFLAYFVIRTTQDKLLAFLFSSTFWLFTWTLYVYAIVNTDAKIYNLYDPYLAAEIIFASQMAMSVVALFFSSAPQVYTGPLAEHRTSQIHKAIRVFVFLSLSAALLNVSALRPAIIIFLAAETILHGRIIWRKPALWLLVALFLFDALTTNSRSAFLDILIPLLAIAMMVEQKMLTIKKVVIGLICVVFISVFSDTILSIRHLRDEGVSMYHAFFQELPRQLSNFGKEESQVLTGNEYNRLSGYYSPFFGLTDAGLIERFTLTPQMDIATGQVPPPASVDWGQLTKVLGSALPSIGQEKELILSDKIIWGLGLRPRDSIGRPLISFQGELFVLGGTVLVFMISAVFSLLLALGYRFIHALTGSRTIAVMYFLFLLPNAIVSTTVLSVFAVAIRAPISFTLVFLLGLMFAKVRLGIAPFCRKAM